MTDKGSLIVTNVTILMYYINNRETLGMRYENSLNYIQNFLINLKLFLKSRKQLYTTGSSAWCSVMTYRCKMVGGRAVGLRVKGREYSHVVQTVKNLPPVREIWI